MDALAPIALTTAEQFEQERLGRAIQNTTDPEVLQALALQLLQAWMTQKAAARWVMAQSIRPANDVIPMPGPGTGCPVA